MKVGFIFLETFSPKRPKRIAIEAILLPFEVQGLQLWPLNTTAVQFALKDTTTHKPVHILLPSAHEIITSSVGATPASP